MNKKLRKEIESRQKRYAAAPGAPYSNTDAQLWGVTLEAMQRQGDEITPENVVCIAKSESSPLHKFFEWNDAAAAEEYRKAQARNCINHLLVFTETPQGEQAVKATWSVRVTHEEAEAQRQYVFRSQAESNTDYRMQIRTEAVRELQSWANKYADMFPEFAPIVTAIRSFDEGNAITS